MAKLNVFVFILLVVFSAELIHSQHHYAYASEHHVEAEPPKPPWFKRWWSKAAAGCATGVAASLVVPIPVLSQAVGCLVGGAAGGTSDMWLPDDNGD